LAIACALPNHISYLAGLCIGHFHILRCRRSFRAARSLRRPQRESANGSLDFLCTIRAWMSRIKETEKWDVAGIWRVARRVGVAPGRIPAANIDLFTMAPSLRLSGRRQKSGDVPRPKIAAQRGRGLPPWASGGGPRDSGMEPHRNLVPVKPDPSLFWESTFTHSGTDPPTKPG
jgi:hypothetical protein